MNAALVRAEATGEEVWGLRIAMADAWEELADGRLTLRVLPAEQRALLEGRRGLRSKSGSLPDQTIL